MNLAYCCSVVCWWEHKRITGTSAGELVVDVVLACDVPKVRSEVTDLSNSSVKKYSLSPISWIVAHGVKGHKTLYNSSSLEDGEDNQQNLISSSGSSWVVGLYESLTSYPQR